MRGAVGRHVPQRPLGHEVPFREDVPLREDVFLREDVP